MGKVQNIRDASSAIANTRKSFDEDTTRISISRYTASVQTPEAVTSTGNDMSNEGRYIDSRIDGIEGKLDAKIDGIRDSLARMQKGFDDAERRFERATAKHDTEIALARQQIHQEFKDARGAVASESADNRRHATTVAWATVAGVFAGFAIVITVAGYWISEQGSYAKTYGETQLEIQRAADERAEFRESVKAIQDTQKAILERLPPATTE